MKKSIDESAILDDSTTPGDEQEPVETSPADEAATVETDPLTAAQHEAERLKETWMRTAAEFDNFRKRARREVEDAKKAGKEELLREVLPVFDNLERAIQSAHHATDVKGVSEGLSMVLKQLEATLGRISIAKIVSVGTPFNPAMHEAIQQVETNDHPAGTVIAEVQPGYMQGDRLIRASMVVVAKAKTADAEPN